LSRRRPATPWLFCSLTLFAVATLSAALETQTSRPSPSTPELQRPANPAAEAARLNNLGVAYMNQQDLARALQLFRQARALEPKLYIAVLNEGIALLNQQKLDDAGKILREAAAQSPNDARVWFNLGLLYKNQAQPEKALVAFNRILQLDAEGDADVFYFIGFLHAELQHYDQAVAAFRRAIAINPFHVSAEFGLSRAFQRKGDSSSALEHLNRFQKLTQEKLGAPISARYGEQGRLSLAAMAATSAPAVPPAIPVQFTDVTVQAGLSPSESGALASATGACWFDYDNDGRPDLFLVNASAQGASVLLHNLGNGRFEDVTHAAKLDIPGPGLGCAAGDFDNDGHTDLAVAFRDGVRLFRNLGDGTFRDVTESAGIRRDPGSVSVLFVDYDHDGDLDLLVTRSPRPAADNSGSNVILPSILWRNNGNGTFTEWSEQTGLNLLGAGPGVAATDFNNDRAVDLVLTGTDGAAVILLNPREGKFIALPAWDASKEKLPRTLGVVALDFDHDGWMDLAFTHDGAPGLTLWRNVAGKRLERVPLPDLGWQRGRGLAAFDFDNDGWVDLAAVGESASGGEIRLLRNKGSAGFEDVTKKVGLDRVKLAQPQALVTADFDRTGATGMLITQLGGPPVLLRNEGGNKNNWLRLSLKALADNRSAIGTKVEIYAGALYQKWEVAGASGYLGQSSTEIIAGLGSERQADIVRLLWPTGVPQDEIHLAARASHTVAELDRRGSSCPMLFAWNGARYEFIADMIGPGIVGHWVGPGERNIPDPAEYLKVDARIVRPRDGRLSFRFAEPMEEVVYLDQVRLLAVDHPRGVEVFPNERFLSNPPFPEFKVIASRGAHPPVGAWDSKGRSVLPELLSRDRRYVTGFARAPYTGYAEMHTLELDLGPWNPAAPLRLLMSGYTDYFTATSMYAAHQAGIEPIAPFVEALDPADRWVRVLDDMGFPAGLSRTMIADLTGHVPPGTRRIRISTNLLIYWDQILVDNTPDGAAEFRVTEAPLVRSSLAFHGYPREVRGNPPSDISYDHEDVSRTGPYARSAGNYTRYGDTTALLKESDDRFVVFGSGDENDLEFDPSALPPLPPGWTRDYFFFADGFTKDMDFYAADAYTVDPLPYHKMPRYPYSDDAPYPSDALHLDYLLNFNTRSVSGPSAPSYLFRFPTSSPPKH
jgi:tetratricopeptide (TPR) repeat protein